MLNTVELECSCGTVKGKLRVVQGSFFHVQCLCCDCQNFASQLKNKEKILDEYGASELFQTYPAYMQINEGMGHIACMQLREKGLLRWYASCCNMPLANTMGSSGIPFVGVSAKLMKFSSEQEKIETLGPVTLKAFGKYSLGNKPEDAHETFPLSYMPKILFFMLKGMIRKMNKPSPFFSGKTPVKKPVVVS